MKDLGKKGFTLVELLAVITIMGILMLVAIPAVSRTIENSRRDTFMDTAKAYINAIKNAVAADELSSSGTPISALGQGFYYYSINSAADSGKDLMEQGGKSSWGSAEVKGYVVIFKKIESGDQGRTKYEYAILLTDTQGRGISELTVESTIKRASVVTASNVNDVTSPVNVKYKGAFKNSSNEDLDWVIINKNGSKTYDQLATTAGVGTTNANAIKCTALTIG